MEWESRLTHAHISAQKARLVADLVRGMPVGAALSTLQFTPKKAAELIRKALQSALDNASKSSGVNEDNLYISRIMIDEGPTAKRWMPRAMGRATRIRKRTSHISIALQEK
jgi:large subunit ribosomal protein L22